MEVAPVDSPKGITENIQNNNSEDKSSSPPLQDGQKKPKKDERNKKDEKNVEQLMKSLNSVPTVEEKLSLVCKKYVQCVDDNKKMQFYVKQSDKRYALLLKEKDQLQQEFNKAILLKSKLENLCRELQKQNKAIKEESLHKIREEEERRKETQAKFQNTLSEITSMLHQNNEKNAKLRDDNISMSEKFKSVVQQYQLREQQVEKMGKQMALESQLADAKLQKASLEHQADKERLMAEMEQLKLVLAQHKARIMEQQAQEAVLKDQLAIYTDKYDEFQTAMVKSNHVVGGFKEEMEKMSKKIKKLEKESLSWKSRWEKSQTALLDMCGARQAGEQRAAAAQRQLGHLQGLCRTLQSERSLLVNTLKEHNIERPPLPAMTPPPAAPPPADNDKVDAMAANCAQLRANLSQLQSQLNSLTNKAEEKPEPPKPEKTKKSKSKKNKKNQENTPKVEEVAPETADSNKENVERPPAETVKTEKSGEVVVAPTEVVAENVDSNAIDTLIQAINEANINVCDLEIVNSESNTTVQNGSVEETTDDKPKIIEITQNGNDSVILETSTNDEPVNIEVKSIPKIES